MRIDQRARAFPAPARDPRPGEALTYAVGGMDGPGPGLPEPARPARTVTVLPGAESPAESEASTVRNDDC